MYNPTRLGRQLQIRNAPLPPPPPQFCLLKFVCDLACIDIKNINVHTGEARCLRQVRTQQATGGDFVAKSYRTLEKICESCTVGSLHTGNLDFRRDFSRNRLSTLITTMVSWHSQSGLGSPAPSSFLRAVVSHGGHLTRTIQYSFRDLLCTAEVNFKCTLQEFVCKERDGKLW